MARNTCLPLHITIGLLESRVLCIKEVVSVHGKFFKTFLSTTFVRDGLPTILSFFRNLKLTDKVCLRLINEIELGHFTLLEQHFGRLSAPTIYIVHSGLHFFLAKKVDLNY